MKILITLDIEQADEEEVRLYLDYVKKQIEKYTRIKVLDITKINPHSEIDKEISENLQLAKHLDWNKKAPSAKGALPKLPPKL